MCFAADEVIKTILLPEMSGDAALAIDLAGREVLPRFALIQHSVFINEGREQMHMVRHHDKVSQLVAFAVKLMQAVADEERQ